MAASLGVVWSAFACPGEGIAALVEPVASREIWIGAGSGDDRFGDGSRRETPLNGSTRELLDRVIEDLTVQNGDYGPGIGLRFLAGTYETGGITLRPNWRIQGEGMDRTFLKRVPTGNDARFRSPHYHVIGGGWGPQRSNGAGGDRLEARDYRNLEVSDLTLDCNWTGMKSVLGPPVKKVAGISVVCRDIKIARVRVIHFGAWGGRPSWREVFPILIRSTDTDAGGFPGYPESSIEVQGCEVVGPVEGPDRNLEWPYCTGIMVGHRDSRPDAAAVHVRVHGNEFRDIENGHAFGGADLKSAVFENNRVVRCGLGFNFDTGGNANVVIRGNEFLDCGGGGTITDGTGFVIENNTIEIRGNLAGKRAWWNNGLRVFDNTRLFRIQGNTIRLTPEPDGASQREITAHGILLHGFNVGVKWVHQEPGGWRHSPLRHQIGENTIDPRLQNRAGPQGPGNWMYLTVEGNPIDLSGITGEAGGLEFRW